jgi:hypothetical protein
MSEGLHSGRVYYACGNSDAPSCVYFQWVDKVKPTPLQHNIDSSGIARVLLSFDSSAPIERDSPSRVDTALAGLDKRCTGDFDCVTRLTGAYDSGLPDVSYDVTYDSDDSDDSRNAHIQLDLAIEDTDDGDGDGDDDSEGETVS